MLTVENRDEKHDWKKKYFTEVRTHQVLPHDILNGGILITKLLTS
jgi:hypothetical protein